MKTIIQALDRRAEALANCRILYGPLVEVVILITETHRAAYQAIAIKVDPESGAWEKFLHGKSESSTADAVSALLEVSGIELSNQIAASGVTVPFEGNHIQRGWLHRPRNGAPSRGDVDFEMVSNPPGNSPRENDVPVAESFPDGPAERSKYVRIVECYPDEPVDGPIPECYLNEAADGPIPDCYPDEAVDGPIPDCYPEKADDDPVPECYPDEPAKDSLPDFYPDKAAEPIPAAGCYTLEPVESQLAAERYLDIPAEPKLREEYAAIATVNSTEETTQNLLLDSKKLLQKAEKRSKKALKKKNKTLDRVPEAQPLIQVADSPSLERPASEAARKHIVEASEEVPKTSFGSTEGQGDLPIRKAYTVVLKIMYTNRNTSLAIQKMVNLASNTRAAIMEAANSYVEEKIDIDHAKQVRKIEIKSAAGKDGELDVSALDASMWPDYLDYFRQYTKFPELVIDVVDVDIVLV